MHPLLWLAIGIGIADAWTRNRAAGGTASVGENHPPQEPDPPDEPPAPSANLAGDIAAVRQAVVAAREEGSERQAELLERVNSLSARLDGRQGHLEEAIADMRALLDERLATAPEPPAEPELEESAEPTPEPV